MIRLFYFSQLYFKLENILDGQDYNGSPVSAARAQDFMGTNREDVYGGRSAYLVCQQSFGELLKDKGECNSVEVEPCFGRGSEVDFVLSQP